ncbi:MAG: glycosyltransferase family 4 protein [Corynebacterium sp.]|uniref:glycosyltransferase family 4 protein n=1 Tax=Corynebacterium sp. TaxID=1720 RepID=UPI0026DAACE7|nr:glycosyltransferase family 4 protein [Corynebacterium sp.]MDO4761462.1 glycosyltransferase family 4 protein [Corynebacterium sp.]
MMRVLLVTNDFPPTVGGIQSYLRDFIATLPAEDVVVFASTQDAELAQLWDSEAPYRVYRAKTRVMLPTPRIARQMQEIIATENIDVVWFGAAAPLAVLAPAARRAGASRVVASTHGHEVGWSMIPGARQVLGFIGRHCDVVTYISEYTLRRFRRAFGDVEFAWLPSGVDTSRFRLMDAAQREAVRQRLGWDSDTRYVVCISRLVPRKGQDVLIRSWPKVVERFPNAELVFVGGGSFETRLRKLAAGVSRVSFWGRVDESVMEDAVHGADVFAMPCRTRGGGLDVEGLGIVFLEAQSAGIPVIAGDSGGAPETVTPQSGFVVNGRDCDEVADRVCALLADESLRHSMGLAGREHVESTWAWPLMASRLRAVLGFQR